MIVLDTHIWHWWTNQIAGKLTAREIALIEEADEIGVSAISCFEMAWLQRHGRIDLGMPFEEWLLEDTAATVPAVSDPETRGSGGGHGAIRCAGPSESGSVPRHVTVTNRRCGRSWPGYTRA
jgi:hypothetical protein